MRLGDTNMSCQPGRQSEPEPSLTHPGLRDSAMLGRAGQPDRGSIRHRAVDNPFVPHQIHLKLNMVVLTTVLIDKGIRLFETGPGPAWLKISLPPGH